MASASSSIVHGHITPDTTIPELVQSLGDDSKHLLGDEVRLAKLEMREAAHHAGTAAKFLAIAFAAVVLTAVAMTVFIATLIGRLADGHMWLGALVAGVIDLVVGGVLLKKGLDAFAEPSHALDELRAAQR
jgi:hypothetical protein